MFASLAIVATSTASAASEQPRFVSGEVLVRFDAGTTAAERGEIRDELDLSVKQVLPISQVQLLKLPEGQSVGAAVSALEEFANVKYAEPNFIRNADFTPNDTLYPEMWGLNNTGQSFPLHGSGTTSTRSGGIDKDIDAPEAWELSTGSPDATVAVMDTGVDYLHPDLAANINTNDGESGDGKETNGLDDDNNGFVDDVIGWDFAGVNYQTSPPDNDPMDNHFHGTHVAGTAAGTGNNGEGVAGVSMQSGIIPVKVLDSSGTGSSAQVAAGIAYAGKVGASVANGSFGSPAWSQIEMDAIEQYPSTLYVFSAGNSNNDNDGDESAFPCSYPAANIVCVAASDPWDNRANFSSYGATTVDLAAPGKFITSAKASVLTNIDDDYLTIDGTSMASPHVAGAAALLKSIEPTATPKAIKSALLDGVDQLPAFEGKTVTGGRLNLYTSAALLNPSAASAQVKVLNGRVVITAGPGASNLVTVSGSSGSITVDDSGTTLLAGSGCSAVNANQVSCSAAATSIRAELGDMNDSFTNNTALAAEAASGAGDDTFNGGSGDEVFDGGPGADVFNGGGGIDTANYDDRKDALSLTLDGNPNDGAAGEGDSITSTIENIVGGTGVDTLTGDGAANKLEGLAGIDTISGGDGDDFLRGGSGADSLDGGNGTDTVSYSERFDSVFISLDGVQNDGTNDEFDNIATNVENLIGGRGDDELQGNGAANQLSGGRGADMLIGNDGPDAINGGSGTDTVSYAGRIADAYVSLDNVADDGALTEGDNVADDVENIDGGAGNDTFVGSSSDNRFRGEAGNDSIVGLGGVDTADYSHHLVSVVATIDGNANDGGPGETDNIATDVENLIGTAQSDNLTGSASDNFIDSGDSDDVVSGGDGDDALRAGQGTDTIVGGAGSDTVDYYERAPGHNLIVNLDGLPNDGEFAESDAVNADIENVQASWGDDTITGNDGDNLLIGSGGSDTINALDGADTVYGEGNHANSLSFGGCWYVTGWTNNIDAGDGNDLVEGGYGIDNIDGGDGDDELMPFSRDLPSDFPAGCTALDNGADDLSGGNGTDSVAYHGFPEKITVTLDDVKNDGWIQDDNIHSDIENIIGGDKGDVLTGNAQANLIDGRAGGDLIAGGAGEDNLIGESGPDRVLAEDGEIDQIDCGSESDSLQSDASLDIDENCESINAVVATVGVENGTLTYNSPGDENDHIAVNYGIGQGLWDPITGEPIYQIVSSWTPMDAGPGCVQYNANEARCPGLGVDEAWFSLGGGNDATSFAEVGYESATILGGADYDQILGSAVDELISGGPGDDSLTSSGGSDTYVGDSGVDTVSYWSASQPVSATLDGEANDGAANEEDFIGNDVENLQGSQFDDTLIGNAADNFVMGGGGEDLLDGRDGNDYMSAGDGDDELIGGDGHDSLWGDSGTNSITGGEGDDAGAINGTTDFQGGPGRDQAFFPNYTVGIAASLDDDANDGAPGEFSNVHSDVEILIGTNNDDQLIGSSADNLLYGYGGNDTLQGLGGTDLHDGDAGNDSMVDTSPENDSFYGGPDSDSVDYGTRTTPVNVTKDYQANDGGVNEFDYVDMQVEMVILGSADDTFTGSDANEVVIGGEGNDTVDMGGGHDNVIPGLGDDVLSGGSGTDNVGYNERQEDVNVSIDGAANDGISGEHDNVGTDFENVQTGSGNDTIIGTAGPEYLAGNAGNDTIRGNGGIDYLIGVQGDDTLDGRDGVADDYFWCYDGNDVALADVGDNTDSTCEAVNYAPDTTIAGGPTDGSTIGDSTPTFTFNSNESGATFECRLDGAAWTTCVSPVTTSTLADGEHTFEARARDLFSADQTPATRTFTVDTTAPNTVIDSGPADGNYDEGSYNFAFHSTDSNATLECRVGGGAWFSCQGGTWSGTLTLNTQVTFEVRSTDAVGNVDPTPATRTFKYVVPALSQTNAATTSPVNLATEGTIAWVHWGLATTPNLTGDRKSGVSTSILSDAVQLNGGTLARVTTGVPSYNWTGGTPTASSSGTTTAITNGAAINRGFRLTAEAVPWQMRTLKLYVGAQNTTGKLTASLSDGSMPTLTDTSVTSSSTTTPTNRVFTIRYRAATYPATLTVEWVKNTTSTASSSKVLLHSATLSASTDTTDPDTSIASGPGENSVVNAATATFGLASNESGVSYQCKVDSGAYTACTTPYTTPTLADGTHTVRFRAIDAAGNIDGTPVTRQFWNVTPIGSLSQLNATIPGTVNLSTEGTTDWAHWGTSSTSLTQDRKSGVTQQISVATKLGSGTTTRLTTGVPSYSWTGGTPTASSAGTTTALATGAGSGRGFRFTVPAVNTAMKTLKVYVGAQNTTGLLNVTLSDGSAVAINDTSVTSSSTTVPTNRVFTINFRSAAPTATLTVSFTQNTSSTASSSRVLLHSATLVNNPDVTAPTTTITAGPADGATVSGSTATYEFSSNESGGTLQCRVDSGAFATCVSPFTTPSLASGSHKFTVRAIDSAGNIEQRPGTRTFIVP